jgi:hypothetical protein
MSGTPEYKHLVSSAKNYAGESRHDRVVSICDSYGLGLPFGILKVSGRRCVVGENEVVSFGRLVARDAGFVRASLPGLPFLKSANPQPPVAASFFGVLNHKLNVQADQLLTQYHSSRP